METKIKNLTELKKFSKKFANCLKGDEIILLYGNLGAGKTTFTKYLVSAVNPEFEDEVNSPTFTVMNVYETGRFPVYHIDLYRVKDFDVSDIIGTGVIVIEWSEYIDLEDISTPIIKIRILTEGEEERKLIIEFENADYVKECLNK